MPRTTRALSHRVGNRSVNTVKGKRKNGIEKTTGKILTSNNTSLLVENENKLNTTKQIANEFDTVKKQSILGTCKSSKHKAHSQNSNNEVITGKNLLTHFFDNTKTVSPCIQIKEEITYIEQFKTDETPVAVPVRTPSTPHKIKMPTEDLDERATITTNTKQPVITLLSPLQVMKKPAQRGRKKGTCCQSVNHRLSKPVNGETNHSITDYFPVRRSVRKSKKVVLEEKQRDLENKVVCQVEDGLEIKNFPGKGRGVVTTREFTKGEFVVEYIGELINQGEAKEREELYAQDQNTGCYMYYFQHRNQQYCVDATAETNKLGRLVNHSRTGNLIARIVEVNSIPHLVLTAKEDIPIGVEVSYDYGDRSRESIRHHPWLAL
ncbi:PREDICTED: histone-lysine N-methyltransferase pr-set7 [Trachymyrmex cornetzi]|uniref:histone-lysine N-methyltransferase pr-set7 n=1 Tax=Trachymyrmex cornetzi TaxID=471704 RepID=UPI00084ED2E3|nr:PREDICTED: histone-lysine N-methyltransferase pr-set7 [Trachymyrmex cornetzi]